MLKKILIIGCLITSLNCNREDGCFKMQRSQNSNQIYDHCNSYQYHQNSSFRNDINFQNQNNLTLTSEIIGKRLFQLCVYHTFLTNQKQFKNLNLKLNNNFLQKISSIDLLDKIVNNKINNQWNSVFNGSYHYKIKENIQNKIPGPILKIISNYMGSLTNITPNNENSLLDMTRYNTEEYNLIQQLGGLHSSLFIENRIKQIHGNYEINLPLLKNLIKEGNAYDISLILSHPNIKRIMITSDEHTNDFHSPKQLTKLLLKNWGPQFNKNGLHIYYHCDHCNNNYWKYLGKDKFNVARLVSEEVVCNSCNNITINSKILGIHNCKYNIEMKKFIDSNKLPFQENLEAFNEKGHVTFDNKFIVLNTLGRLCYFEIFIH